MRAVATGPVAGWSRCGFMVVGWDGIGLEEGLTRRREDAKEEELEEVAGWRGAGLSARASVRMRESSGQERQLVANSEASLWL